MIKNLKEFDCKKYVAYPNLVHDERIQEKLNKLFVHTLNKHNKVFLTRFDVRFPNDNVYPNANNLISNFTESLVRHFKRKKLDPNYLWVREQNDSLNPHYHFTLLLDGNKIQHPAKINKKADELWNLQLGLPQNYRGLIDYCNRISNGIMVYRHDIDSFISASEWVSYLAKPGSKNINRHYRSVGMSRVEISI